MKDASKENKGELDELWKKAKHESIDFVQLAKQDRKTYKERLNRYLSKTGGDPEDEEYFIQDELEQIEADLSERNQFTVGHIWDAYKRERLKYKKELEVRLNDLRMNDPKPQEIEKKDELHGEIFKDGAFELWRKLFGHWNLDETKRTGFRFLYEVMRRNGQIHGGVTVTQYTNWINRTFQFSIEKLQYTDCGSKSNGQRMKDYKLFKG